MSIKKQYLNDGYSCKVTFEIPKKIVNDAKSACVVGEFNNWSYSATPMKKLKNGSFVTTIELPIDREYQFRYFLDDKVWLNDREADSFVPTPFGDSENCVITTYNDCTIKMIKAQHLNPQSLTSDINPLIEPFQDKSQPPGRVFQSSKAITPSQDSW